MIIHKVKSWVPNFEASIAGQKTSDIRFVNERDYKIGDELVLQETDIGGNVYTGREAGFLITHIISKNNACALSNDVLAPEACILSIDLLWTNLGETDTNGL